MLSPTEKQALRNTVEQFLLTVHQITPDVVTPITDVVLKNWFEDLEKGYSHLTAKKLSSG